MTYWKQNIAFLNVLSCTTQSNISLITRCKAVSNQDIMIITFDENFPGVFKIRYEFHAKIIYMLMNMLDYKDLLCIVRYSKKCSKSNVGVKSYF